MQRKLLSTEEFKTVLFEICSKETSQDPDGWSDENILWGHCAVVSLLAQDIFGGVLLRASLEGTEFEHMRSHYWNKLEDGREVDFTEPQFEGKRPCNLNTETRTREYVLSNKDTERRYKLFCERFNDYMFLDG